MTSIPLLDEGDVTDEPSSKRKRCEIKVSRLMKVQRFKCLNYETIL